MMKNIIIATLMFIVSQFTMIETTKAQTYENMHVYVTRNQIPNQAVWSGTAINTSPGIYPNVSKFYSSFSSSFNWSYNGIDALGIQNYYGDFESFWLRPTLNRPNRRINIRVVTPGTTVNCNGVVLTYEGIQTYSWPIGQSFYGNVLFNSNTTQFQQVIFSAVRD